jgi:hypothetical protein
MLISSMVAQDGGGGLDIIWWILPLLCCMLASQQRERAPTRDTVTENWYTVQDVEAAYDAVVERAAEWREEALTAKPTSEPLMSKVSKALGGGGRDVDRFVEGDAKPPRLYRMRDRTGPIYFELTEVEGGGTVVKATYSPMIKVRMAKLKADLPLRIPATPVGHRCPACGKPVLPEFNVCPYCGEKMIEE